MPVITQDRCSSRGSQLGSGSPGGLLLQEVDSPPAKPEEAVDSDLVHRRSKAATLWGLPTNEGGRTPSGQASRSKGTVLFRQPTDEFDRRRETAAFYKMARGDTEVPSDVRSLTQLWALAGYNYSLNTAWLAQIVETEVFGRSMLDLDDYFIVWDAYMKRVAAERREAFEEAATREENGQRMLSVGALPGLLLRLGMQPMEGAISQMLEEVGCVMDDDNEEVSFETFLYIYSELYMRAGLTRQEHARVRVLFDRADADGRGSIGSASLHQILRFHDLLVGNLMGLVSETIVEYLIKEIVAQVQERRMTLDPQVWRRAVDSGAWRNYDFSSIDWPAFCLVVCVLHSYIAQAFRVALGRVNLGDQTAFSEQATMLLFDEIGSVSTSLGDVLRECKADAGIANKQMVTFRDLYAMLLAYCEREGLTRKEHLEVEQIFNLFTKELRDVELGETPGTLCSSELGRALRWLCYRPTRYRFYDFMEKYDRGDSDDLDCHGLLKVVADYRFNAMGMARSFFRTSSDGRSSWHRAPVSELQAMLTIAGHTATGEEATDLQKQANAVNGEIDWREFLRLEVIFRDRQKAVAKANMGFTNAELEELRRDFQSEDVKGNGFILAASLERLIVSRFPEVNFDSETRKLVQDSDIDQNGRTEFQEFLWLVQRLKDRVTKRTVKTARTIRKGLGLSKEEVKDLRELFKQADQDLSGSIDFDELVQIISRLITLCHESLEELRVMMMEVDATGRGALDFWEFLRLMKILNDVNWRNIHGVASKAIGRPMQR